MINFCRDNFPFRLSKNSAFVEDHESFMKYYVLFIYSSQSKYSIAHLFEKPIGITVFFQL